MRVAYRKAGDLFANRYQRFTTFNKVPYTSDTHGGRLVNNYANRLARKAYGKYEKVKRMPIGSILAKDSFTVTKTGAAAAGPLFMMEKMVRGWNKETADWKYTMIMPNGTVFGRTRGKNAAGMAFCHECHVSGEDNDFLLFLPEEIRK